MAKNEGLYGSYHYMKILKTTKQQVRLKGVLYLTDALIIGSGLIIVVALQKMFMLSLTYSILMAIIMTAFTVFLCMKPVQYGGERNIVLMFRLLKMDREVYRYQSLRKLLEE